MRAEVGPVVRRWKLSYEDIEHYQRVAVALERTMALMARIDERIEEWPIA